MLYIGIDPDIDNSGVATYSNESKEILLNNLNLPELIKYIKCLRNNDILVVIEKGEENKSIFHVAKNKTVASKIGVNVGKNFAVTKIIADFMKHYNIDFEYFVPNKKTPKLNHATVKAMFDIKTKRTNQEQRDALRCIVKYYD